MLTIVTRSKQEFTWHVGDRVPVIEETIVELHADGHELEYLEKNRIGGVNLSPSVRVFKAQDITARAIYTGLCGSK